MLRSLFKEKVTNKLLQGGIREGEANVGWAQGENKDV